MSVYDVMATEEELEGEDGLNNLNKTKQLMMACIFLTCLEELSNPLVADTHTALASV